MDMRAQAQICKTLKQSWKRKQRLEAYGNAEANLIWTNQNDIAKAAMLMTNLCSLWAELRGKRHCGYQWAASNAIAHNYGLVRWPDHFTGEFVEKDKLPKPTPQPESLFTLFKKYVKSLFGRS
jgi:hypothetical protein